MSPTHGQKVPVVATFHAEGTQTIGANRLAVRPYPGFPLADGTTYALVITNRVHDADGDAVARDGDFSTLDRRRRRCERERRAFAPLFDVARREPAATSARTSCQRDRVHDAARDDVRSRDCARACSARRRPSRPTSCTASTGAAYIDRSPATTRAELPGRRPPYITSGGEITIGADGAAVVQRTEPMRFALTRAARRRRPRPAVRSRSTQHGTGGDWRVVHRRRHRAAQLAAQGIATISTDQVLHGPRDPAGTIPEIAFFNFNNPVAGRDNPLQGAADAWSQHAPRARPVDRPTANSRTITFDPNQRVLLRPLAGRPDRARRSSRSSRRSRARCSRAPAARST